MASLDDSGAFRISAKADAGASEVRIAPKIPTPPSAPPTVPPAAQPMNRTATPGTAPPLLIGKAEVADARVSLPNPFTPSNRLGSADSAPRVSSADAPPEVRVPIPPPPAAAITPKTAKETDHWVRLPDAARPALRFANWEHRVAVSARRLEFPPQCPCCNLAADLSYEAVVAAKDARQSTKSWTFPYCGECLRHARMAVWLRRGVAAAAIGAGLLMLAACGAIGWLLGAVINGAITGVVAATVGGAAIWFLGQRPMLMRFARGLRPECACHGPAVRYAKYYGSEQYFEFASERYAEAFAACNVKKVIAES